MYIRARFPRFAISLGDHARSRTRARAYPSRPPPVSRTLNLFLRGKSRRYRCGVDVFLRCTGLEGSARCVCILREGLSPRISACIYVISMHSVHRTNLENLGGRPGGSIDRSPTNKRRAIRLCVSRGRQAGILGFSFFRRDSGCCRCHRRRKSVRTNDADTSEREERTASIIVSYRFPVLMIS